METTIIHIMSSKTASKPGLFSFWVTSGERQSHYPYGTASNRSQIARAIRDIRSGKWWNLSSRVRVAREG